MSKLQAITAIQNDATLAFGRTYKGLDADGKAQTFTKHATISDGADWIADGEDPQLFADALANLNPELFQVDPSTGHIFGLAAAFHVAGGHGGRVFPVEVSGIDAARDGSPVLLFKVKDPKGVDLPHVRGGLRIGTQRVKSYTVAASSLEPAKTRARGVCPILCVAAEVSIAATAKAESALARIEKRKAKAEGASVEGAKVVANTSITELPDGSFRVAPVAESGAVVSGIEPQIFAGEGARARAEQADRELAATLASA